MTTGKYTPVNGNEYFSSLSTLSSQIPRVEIVKGNLGSVQSEMINSNFSLFYPSPLNTERLYSITANSSSDFLGMVGGSTQFLNTNPGQRATTSVEGGVLTLPPGATIVGCYAIDQALTGPIAVFIGTSAVTGFSPAPSGNLISTTPAYLNTGTQVTAQTSISGAGFGGTGVPPISGTVTIPQTGSTGVTVTVGGNVLTSSGLKVTLFFLPKATPPNTA